MLNLAIKFKIIYLQLRADPDNEYVTWLYTFQPMSSISFAHAFFLNNLLLFNLITLSLFFIMYILTSELFSNLVTDAITSLQLKFFLQLIPAILAVFYFPTLMDQNNYIKNYRIAAFFDSIYNLLGLTGSVFRAITRYFLALAIDMIIGLDPTRSIYPDGLQRLDNLYKSFYATVLV